MPRIHRIHRDQRGFTLTELMTIIGVVGILMAIVIPNIQQQIARQQLHGSARELVSVLRNARSAAMNEGVPRYVLLRPGTPATYQVYRFSGEEWVAEGIEVPLEGQVGFSEADVDVPTVPNAPVAGNSVPADAVYFDTRGRYPFGPGFTGRYTIRLRAQVGDPLELTFYPQTGQVTGA